ncbi:MAG: preprotein translocase subunit SecG [Burkholderiaceae bacterium]
MLWFTNLLQVVQVLSALGVIILVLLQHGKGADMGAAFGSGSSGSLFGATGSANFLSRSTSGCAVLFFVTTLGLAFVSSRPAETGGSLMEGVSTQTAPAVSDVPGTDGALQPSGDANSQIPATQAPDSDRPSDIPK